jgi:uncharacterized protein YggU (UPF0235/DUF167 family)
MNSPAFGPEGENMPFIIRVHVRTRAHEEKIEQVDLETFNVWVTATPTANEANEAVIEVVADYFNTAPSNVRIKSGMHGKHKFIEIDKPAI